MGCSPIKSEATRLVQIALPGRQLPAAKASNPGRASKSRVRKRIDFHCAECGVTKEAYPNYRHACNPGPVGYQVTRLAICGQCVMNEGGVCLAVKEANPGKEGLIEIGVAMPSVRCLLGKWERVLWSCDKCGSVVFKEHGISQCPVCSPAKPKPDMIKIPKFSDSPAVPTRPLAIVSVAAGQKAIDLSKLTWPRMRQYAEFVGADFVGITDDQSPEWPVANKFRVGKVCSLYERSLYLDVDTWIRPAIGNVFNDHESGFVYMFPDMSKENYDWSNVKPFSQRLADEYNLPFVEMRCHNSGVVLFDKTNWSVWNPPEMLGSWWVSEQYWVARQAIEMGVLRDLPQDMNTQWYWPDFRKAVKAAKIVHLAACPHGERITRLKHLARIDSDDFV